MTTRSNAFLSGLAAAATFSGASMAIANQIENSWWWGFNLFVFMPIAIIWSVVLSILIGGPVFFILFKLKAVTAGRVIFLGVMVGAMSSTISSLPMLDLDRRMLLMSVIGGVSAFLFWIFWRRAEI